MCRHDDLTNMMMGREVPTVHHRGLDAIYAFAQEKALPILVHHNCGRVNDRSDEGASKYVHEVEDVLRRFPTLIFVWVHAGVSRGIAHPAHHEIIDRYIHTYARTCTCTYACTRACTCMHMYAHVCTCMQDAHIHMRTTGSSTGCARRSTIYGSTSPGSCGKMSSLAQDRASNLHLHVHMGTASMCMGMHGAYAWARSPRPSASACAWALGMCVGMRVGMVACKWAFGLW